jgi:hypothetical protein
MKRIKRAKLFVFLRQHRHTLFDGAFQEQLATIYKDAPQGQPPIPPAQVALATILQAYTGLSDDEVIEATLETGAGNWCWTVSILRLRRLVKPPWSRFATC